MKRELTEAGQLHMELKEYKEAVKDFNAVYKLDPRERRFRYNLEDACMALAVEYAKDKNWEQAIAYSQSAYDLNPFNEKIADIIADYYAQYGNETYGKGDLTAAESHFQKALGFNDKNWQAHDGLGNVEYDLAKFDSAASHWKRALAFNFNLLKTKQLLGIYEQISSMEKKFLALELGYFAISYEGRENKELALKVSRILQKTYLDISAKEGYYPKAYMPVTVFLSEQYEKLMKEPTERPRLYDGVIKIHVDPAEDDALLEQRIREEFKRALLYQKAKDPQGGKL